VLSCQLFVAVLQLEPADDGFQIVGQLNLLGAAVALPEDVANTVHDRLTEERLKGGLVPRLELVEAPQGRQNRVLN
jgi:hypothetical protein